MLATSSPSTARAQTGDPSGAATAPILVTGSHRSGTTWVGRVLAASPSLGYIHEPFNIEGALGTSTAPVRHWYTYVHEGNAARFQQPLQDCLSFRYQTVHGLAKMQAPRDVARVARDTAKFGLYRWQRRRPLVKDPLALFAAPWLASQFGMRVVVMIRHPAAFVGSLVKARWHFPFSHLAVQRELIHDRLRQFDGKIQQLASQQPDDIVEQGIVLWRITHAVIRQYQSQHPKWTFLRHEDLSRAPRSGFRELTERLDIPHCSRLQRRVVRTSGHKNKSSTASTSDITINSAANVLAWKKILRPEDVERIKRRTDDLWPLFYGEADWC